VSKPRRRAQLHQGRQKAGQRLAGAGGRDQQRGAVVARLLEQRELVRARRPAAAGEPFSETVRQQRRLIEWQLGLVQQRHP